MSAPSEAVQRWLDDRLAEAPPITPKQATILADILAGARSPEADKQA